MYVTCSTLCFAKLPLDEALDTIRRLRFAKADLAVHQAGPHLTPADVLSDPGRVAQRLRTAGVPFAAFHLDFGSEPDDVATAQLVAAARLARVLTVPVLTVPAAATGTEPDAEAARLARWTGLVAAEGVILTVETCQGTVTADPAAAVELCDKVPGLGLTLDPSEYHVSPHGPVDYDAVFPHVRHVRLRDSGTAADEFQVRVGQGSIEYGRVFAQLDRYGYDRALTVDVRDIADSPFPIEPEVRKLKYLLESLI